MSIRPYVSLSLLWVLLAVWTSPARGDQTLIVNVTLNREPQGDVFVTTTNAGDFMIRVEDLKRMGFREPRGSVVMLDGEPHLLLRSFDKVTAAFDETRLTLDLTADPSLLSTHVIDFATGRAPATLLTEETAGFLNYRVDYTRVHPSDTGRFDLTTQLGVSHRRALYLTDVVYTPTEENRNAVRLMSAVTIDQANRKERVMIGDFFAQSGELGNNLILGGVSWSKIYLIDPYFIKHPQLDFAGTVPLRSELQVLLDGIPIRREQILPGEFQLRNMANRAGLGTLEIVLEDAFGREQRLVHSFYTTDSLLKRGLHEYSYNLGSLRKRFGEASFAYGSLAGSAFHRYGVNDRVTVGFQFEGSRGTYTLGPSATARVYNAGVGSLTTAVSRGPGGPLGGAASLGYGYQARRLTGRALLRWFSEEYERVANDAATAQTLYQAGLGFGYGTPELGFFNVDYTTDIVYSGENTLSWTATYSRILARHATVLTAFTHRTGDATADEAIIQLQYTPRPDVPVAVRYQRHREGQSEIVQAQKNAPVGEGFGGRFLVERSSNNGSDIVNTLDLFAQGNLQHGTYSADYRQMGGESVAHLSASGGIAAVGHAVRFSRPINDAFALVQVEDIPGVRVYHNHQEIGRTDASGRLLIPTMSSYLDNQVSINDRDIPLDRSLTAVDALIAPPLRGGAFVRFAAKRFRALTGRIVLRTGETLYPIEFREVTMIAPDKEVAVPTGLGGEFYLEDIAPGSYRATIETIEGRCSVIIEVPTSQEPITDLGEIVCDATP